MSHGYCCGRIGAGFCWGESHSERYVRRFGDAAQVGRVLGQQGVLLPGVEVRRAFRNRQVRWRVGGGEIFRGQVRHVPATVEGCDRLTGHFRFAAGRLSAELQLRGASEPSRQYADLAGDEEAGRGGVRCDNASLLRGLLAFRETGKRAVQILQSRPRRREGHRNRKRRPSTSRRLDR